MFAETMKTRWRDYPYCCTHAAEEISRSMDTRPGTHATDLFSKGVYTVREAGELTGIEVHNVRRWLIGYARRLAGEKFRSEPLWTPEIPRSAPELELGFRDLMELRFVAGFVGAGVSVPAIRYALAIGREVIGVERPFSAARFRTDGRRVLLRMSCELGRPTWIDVLSREDAFEGVVEPIFRDVDYDEAGPKRWWPMSRRSNVVVDPQRNFGHPVLADHGVPTRAIADAVAAEGSADKAALVYDLPVAAVRDALAFERRAA